MGCYCYLSLQIRWILNMMKWYWIQLLPIKHSIFLRSHTLAVCLCQMMSVYSFLMTDTRVIKAKEICEISANSSSSLVSFHTSRSLIYKALTFSRCFAGVLIWKSLLVFNLRSSISRLRYSTLWCPSSVNCYTKLIYLWTWISFSLFLSYGRLPLPT